jgi:methyl-accepting chemotaxis protein
MIQWFLIHARLTQKFTIAFGVIIAFLMVNAIVAVLSIGYTTKNAQEIHDYNLIPISLLGELEGVLHNKRVFTRDIVVHDDVETVNRTVASIRSHHAKMDSLLALYEPLISSAEERDAFNKLIAEIKKYRASRDKIIEFALAGQKDEAIAFMYGEDLRETEEMFRQLRLLIRINREQAAIFEEQTVQRGKIVTLVMVAVAIVSVLIALGVGRLLNYCINGPIREITEKANKVAAGDIKQSVVMTGNDELGQLGRAFNDMAANLEQSISALAKEKQSVEKKIEDAVARSEAERRFLKNSFDRMLESVEMFAQGDLTQELEILRDDSISSDEEIEGLIHGYNAAVESIRGMVTQVAAAVEMTATVTAHIASSAEEMSAGIEEEARQISVVADTVNKIAADNEQSAREARFASEQASEASNEARHGGEIISGTIQGINRLADVVLTSSQRVRTLGESSRQIGEIVQVIEEIADQTNLLALNAAIEAARAGEQGRGFAVVADEVRKLAERTQQATKQIGAMIQQIQRETAAAVAAIETGTQEVDAGKASATRAAEALEGIIGRIDKVTAAIEHLARSSEAQTRASKEIAVNLDGISAVAEESSQTTAEIARTIEDLNQTVHSLQQLVARFTIDARSQTRLIA